jgi:hypothetical protein
MRTISVPTVMGNRRTTSIEVSEQLKAASRVDGAVFEEVMDAECAADGCERIFVQRLPGQEFCLRHRTRTEET